MIFFILRTLNPIGVVMTLMPQKDQGAGMLNHHGRADQGGVLTEVEDALSSTRDYQSPSHRMGQVWAPSSVLARAPSYPDSSL